MYIGLVARIAQSVWRLATGWAVRGSNSGEGDIFRTCPDRPWCPPSPLYNGYRVFAGGKERPGRDANPSPLLVPSSRKSRAIPLLPLWAVWPVQSLSACTLELYLYSPLWAVWPVQSLSACTLELYLYSPLWAVQPVQSLSACTVQLYLYSPYGPYCLYRASLPVQYSYTSTPPMGRTACTEPQCLYSTAIPLLPLWAVLPVQYSYTSTLPMGRTACTERQCL